MSKKAGTVVNFTSKDLAQYAESTKGQPLEGVGGLVMLSARMHTPGLKAVNEDLDQGNINKEGREQLLIQDLAEFCRRPGFERVDYVDNDKRQSMPPFKEEFLTPAGRKKNAVEYKNFIECFAKIPITQLSPEIIAARALVALNNGQGAQNAINEGFGEFKLAEEEQFERDVARADIFIKNKDGEVKKVTLEELQKEPKKFGLTTAQAASVVLFHQGTFDGGMHVLAGQKPPTSEELGQHLQGGNGAARTNIIIQVSDEGVKFSSRLVLQAVELKDPPVSHNAVENTISLDVPKEGFGKPGCGELPKIEYTSRVLYDGVQMDVPAKLKTTKSEVQAEAVKAESIQGYLNVIPVKDYEKYIAISVAQNETLNVLNNKQPKDTKDRAAIKEINKFIADQRKNVPGLARLEAIVGKEEAGRLIDLKAKYEKLKVEYEKNPEKVNDPMIQAGCSKEDFALLENDSAKKTAFAQKLDARNEAIKFNLENVNGTDQEFSLGLVVGTQEAQRLIDLNKEYKAQKDPIAAYELMKKQGKKGDFALLESDPLKQQAFKVYEAGPKIFQIEVQKCLANPLAGDNVKMLEALVGGKKALELITLKENYKKLQKEDPNLDLAKIDQLMARDPNKPQDFALIEPDEQKQAAFNKRAEGKENSPPKAFTFKDKLTNIGAVFKRNNVAVVAPDASASPPRNSNVGNKNRGL